MNHNMTDADLSLVREMIVSRFGLHFPATSWCILRIRLSSAAIEFGYQDMHEFSKWLLSSELSKDQLKILASHLTVCETYFWRERAVFKALTDNVLPELIEGKTTGEKRIRIWSAGCATGEEQLGY
jgi:chemotaxis protein methyltransferase CheR